MDLMVGVNEFIGSPTFQNAWTAFNKFLLWLSLFLLPVAAGLLFTADRKYRKKIKQLKKDVHAPGMEDIRFLFKHKLKEHGIDPDDKHHERN